MTLVEIINSKIENNPLEIQSFLNENSVIIDRNHLGITFSIVIPSNNNKITKRLISFEHYIMGDTIIIYNGNELKKLSFYMKSEKSVYVFLDRSVHSNRLTLDIVPIQVKQLLEILNIQMITHKITFVISNQNIEIVDKLIV